MSLGAVTIGTLNVSRLILGGNPFSGGSHQSAARNKEMSDYYTVGRIKETLHQAAALGITTFIGRADRHIIRLLNEYWNEGGKIQWIAQTCPEMSSIALSVQDAIAGGASAIYLHRGQIDNLLALHEVDEIAPAIAQIHQAGLPAGIAGHQTPDFRWAEENLDVDFYMCAYYNPSNRGANAAYDPRIPEAFLAEDRQRMVDLIPHLHRPVIHYKIFAAGRNDPRQAFAFVAEHLRPQDAVCIGVFTKDNPNMLAEDVALFEEAVGKR